MLTTDLLAFVRAALPAPPAHLLEIGAGQGELAATLDAAGYQVTAIDPAAEDESHVQRATLLDVHGNFDAALAVVALHHVEPLEASCAHLAGLTPYFALGEPVPGPYLHRWNLEPGLRDAEEHLIATGQLPATGARLIGTRLPT